MMQYDNPIGHFLPQPFSLLQKREWVLDLANLPLEIEYAVLNLDEAQLKIPYRDGGWNVHQIVHHVADSHMNAYIRCKLALTEMRPTIKAYDEALWATLADVDIVPINISITLLHALHVRWQALFNGLNKEDWIRTFVHPQSNELVSLWEVLGLYVWHGKHHTAQIVQFRNRMNW